MQIRILLTAGFIRELAHARPPMSCISLVNIKVKLPIRMYKVFVKYICRIQVIQELDSYLLSVWNTWVNEELSIEVEVTNWNVLCVLFRSCLHFWPIVDHSSSLSSADLFPQNFYVPHLGWIEVSSCILWHQCFPKEIE